MKIQQIFLLSLLTLLLFSSCKKEKAEPQFFVTGQVTEFGTDKPIENAFVTLYECTADFSGSACFADTIVRTDAAGMYRVPFPSVAGRFPMIAVEADRYYNSNEVFVNENRNNQIDFVLDPHVWLNIHVKNIPPMSDFDVIRLAYEFGLEGWNELVGGQVDENIVGLVNGGNKDAFLRWDIYHSGILQEENRDTINIPAHDTLHYEILY